MSCKIVLKFPTIQVKPDEKFLKNMIQRKLREGRQVLKLVKTIVR